MTPQTKPTTQVDGGEGEAVRCPRCGSAGVTTSLLGRFACPNGNCVIVTFDPADTPTPSPLDKLHGDPLPVQQKGEGVDEEMLCPSCDGSGNFPIGEDSAKCGCCDGNKHATRGQIVITIKRIRQKARSLQAQVDQLNNQKDEAIAARVEQDAVSVRLQLAKDTIICERDQLRSDLERVTKERDQIWSHTCVHHTDAERFEASQKCPVCLLAENGKAIDFCIALTTKTPDEILEYWRQVKALEARLTKIRELAAKWEAEAKYFRSTHEDERWFMSRDHAKDLRALCDAK